MRAHHLVLVNFFVLFAHSQYHYDLINGTCRGKIAGDCDPYECAGGCEAKYARFYDPNYGRDRTYTTCFCQQERLCSVLGMHAFSANYRYWSMDAVEKKNRNSNDVRLRYSDKTRHLQLLNGNSRFCCRQTIQKRYALQLKSQQSAGIQPTLHIITAVVFAYFLY
ncbi:unnamed protein product [Caenorhabditis bovis]|uniref:Uncharacterized protein n=1 Tax=Caenorhabditis bovis TaxID=2654633 RepID=A0A8S1EQ74_9PELO|nr:unnamed protein product [Caenorhabditis bovis]